MRRVHEMPFGATITDDGVRFALWAPTAQEVALVLDGAERPLTQEDGGWHRLTVPEARAGSRYAFRIDGGLVVPDPASRFQPDDVHRESVVVDPAAYTWSDGSWTGRPWEETVLSELHVGTATPEGTYAGLMGKLEDLRDAGITAIELLPLAEFPGSRNWGYDGVLHYAPDAAYGTPDDLKRLVDRAHALGLMVFIDVVYNHFGPSGNYLHAYAKSFFTERHQTPWGAGINFDGSDATAVRDFFVHNAIYWLEEYHADGLRFDAVHAILDDSEKHILAEIAERARAALPNREVHLVLENDANEARWLGRDGGRPRLHTAQWDDDLHHSWHTLLTGEADGYYVDYADRPVERLGRCLAEGFAYQGEPSAHRDGEPRGEPSAHLPPSAFVGFLQNHDQIGNRAFGERIGDLASPERLALARAGLLLSPQIPLLYMGEEWAASTPFLYFVDFAEDEALSNAVREGRRREFANFKSFAEGGHDQIPDPTLEETFTRSKLDWQERSKSPHAEVLAETRRLLELRQAEVVPLTKTRFIEARSSQPKPGLLDVVWRYEGGTLRFVANFGESPAEVEVGSTGSAIWSSSNVEHEGGRARLPSWTGMFIKDSAR
ncbi:malto-oligosyltrehalose trehalohydrolase [Microvirga lenta]|uniref:malto-oligosyltrehalose trehalohydrolase n=1 Tax=Microvirga lenta TaxID=2881337 RepID=UPI001CFF6144|nr:malto-oligosyltrehalose trehalohydrolase [Microvirga lenta]MCB5177369.1 malto-oligosyltrehalose trehalohydrolase [Microvirga lenta]